MLASHGYRSPRPSATAVPVSGRGRRGGSAAARRGASARAQQPGAAGRSPPSNAGARGGGRGARRGGAAPRSVVRSRRPGPRSSPVGRRAAARRRPIAGRAVMHSGDEPHRRGVIVAWVMARRGDDVGDPRRNQRGRGHRNGADLDRGRDPAGAGRGDELGHAPGRLLVRGRRAQQPVHERHRGDGGHARAQRAAGSVHELAQRAVGETQLGRDLGVRAALDGDRQQRFALALGQPCDAGQGLTDHVAALGVLSHRARALKRLVQLVVVIARALQPGGRRVVGDAVQPPPQLPHLGARAQRGPGVDERLLEGVLGARRGQHPAQVAGQRAAVALDDRLECAVVPVAGQPDEALVGLGAQQRGGQRRRHGRKAIGPRRGVLEKPPPAT